MLDVVDSERFEEVVRIAFTADERLQLRVVIVAATDRFFEDRRVRRHPTQTRIDETPEFARSEHTAVDVVEPNALPDVDECFELRSHGNLLNGSLDVG